MFGAIERRLQVLAQPRGDDRFAALFWLTVRRGATDPVCGMRVDRATAVVRRTPAGTRYFCSEHCAAQFDAGAAHGDGAVAHGGAAVHGDGATTHARSG